MFERNDLMHQASFGAALLRKIYSTPEGEKEIPGQGATGFFFRDDKGDLYLISAWHVFTSRKTFEKSHLLGSARSSPFKLVVDFWARKDTKIQRYSITVDLYRGQRALWLEHPTEDLADIAVLKISVNPEVRVKCVQDFHHRIPCPVEIGTEVVITGFPIAMGDDNRFAIWKRAMIASEPKLSSFGSSQVLIDVPGEPGMSGTPVYRNRPGHISNTLTLGDRYANLSFIGVYAGSTGKRELDRLGLGRIFLADTLNEIITQGVPGNAHHVPEIF